MATRQPEHYTPKSNRNWQRKKHPISLKSLCLSSIMGQVCCLNVAQNPDKGKAMSKVLYDNLPAKVLEDLLVHARQCLLSPKNLINLMEVLPKEIFARRVDLIGSYSGTECCKSNNSLNWLYGFIPEITVNADHCTQLYKILTNADLSKLSALSLWAAPDSLKPSSMPNVVARAKNLTKLVLRGGTDDHLLRIIGKNCVCLKYLDVSRCPRISNKGIRKLFLAKPESKTPVIETKTPLASTLDTFIISISGLIPNELYLAARYMNMAYVETTLPEYTMTRVTLPDLHLALQWKAGMNLSPYENFGNCFQLSDWTSTELVMRTALRTHEYLEVDVYRGPENRILLYIREKTFLLKALFTVTIGFGITEMSLYWDKFNWDIEQLIFLADLVNAIPNVERLKCRLRGGWDWPGPIFPKLKILNAWCLEDSSMIAFLGHCPSLQTVDIKNVRALVPEKRLTHEVLLNALESNAGFKETIEDLVIRPTDLTFESLLSLHQTCPKLQRIGDLECWDVTEDEISKMNRYLDKTNSKTTLIVLSFPPNLNGVN